MSIIIINNFIVFVGVTALQKRHTPLTTDSRAAQTNLQSTPVIVINTDSSDDGDFKPKSKLQAKKSQQRRKVCVSLTTKIAIILRVYMYVCVRF